MRLLIFVQVIGIVAACTGADRGDSDRPGPVRCGDQTCGSGQLCATVTAGQTCDGGGYAVLYQYCMNVPASCDGAPSCGCIPGCDYPAAGVRPCLDVYDDRNVSCGCF